MDDSPPQYVFPVLLADPSASRARRVIRKIHARTQVIRDLTLTLSIAVLILAVLGTFSWLAEIFD